MVNSNNEIYFMKRHIFYLHAYTNENPDLVMPITAWDKLTPVLSAMLIKKMGK